MTQSFKPASVMHDELVGTAAADFPDSMRELARYAGIDGEQWLVVAVEMNGSYRASWGAVLAVPMPPERRHVNWIAYAQRNGGVIPVRRFPVRHSDLRGSIPQGLGLFTQLKRWSVRLVIPALQGFEMSVMVDG